MPCTIAPCIWPATICGLMMRPTSSDVVQLRIFHWPVFTSTSTLQQSALKQIIGLAASKNEVCSRPPLIPWRQVDRRHDDALDHLAERLAGVRRALVDDLAVLELELIRVDVTELEVVRHDLCDLALEIGARLVGGADEIRAGAGADRARAERRRAGVAGLHDDVVGMDAESVGDHLRDRGLVALAARRVALEHEHLAARIEAHGRGAVAGLVLHRHEQLRGDARELDADREADAEIAPLLARLGLLAGGTRRGRPAP